MKSLLTYITPIYDFHFYFRMLLVTSFIAMEIWKAFIWGSKISHMVLTKKQKPHGRRERTSQSQIRKMGRILPIVGSRTPACQAQLLHLTDCGLACLLFRLVWAVIFWSCATMQSTDMDAKASAHSEFRKSLLILPIYPREAILSCVDRDP